MICLSLFGQTESEILSEANKLFKSESFVQATPLYLRLLSLSPKNNDYNFRYGTCLLFNADKKQEALRYLKFATESPNIDPEAHFYLGKAYHLNYLFNDAVRSYVTFEELAGAKASNDKQIDRLIETCQNGRRLLMNYSEMIVFDKKEIEADKFFRLYDTKDIGGTIIVTADYQSKLDKKMGHIPLIFFGKNATEIFYSSYGEDMADGKQIYRRKRESSGKWGDAQLIKGKVNTKFDEDYCYKSQDGKYLYFSSKGHNSMGGYDVFRSPYDASSDSFGEPENMDFAVSSPDDDIFFLVDANNENGYFASARQSESGKLYVYKIRVDKLPTELSIIAGQYESKITQLPAQLKVQVETLESKVIGQFKSDKNGQIVLSFPTGGQYRYKMNLEGSSEIYIANVNVPFIKGIKPVRQSFVHFMENGSEVLKVLDRFDESVAEKDDILATVFANKANLDPNSDKFDLNNLNNVKEIEEVLAFIGAEGMTMNEVALERSKQIAKTLDENMISSSIDNTYDEVSQNISEDTSLIGVTKLMALKEHDQSYATKVKARQSEIQNRLSTEPNKLPEFQKELELLSTILSDKENAIALKESEIARLENAASTIVSTFTQLTQKEQEMSMLSDLNASYLDQKESFERNTKDNLDEELKLDREMLAQLKSEKQKLNTQTQSAKIAAINRLEYQIKEDIQENELNLVAFSESRQELIERLASNYSLESENLNDNQGLTELNKTKAKVALDEALINSLSKEKSKISKLAEENPNVQSLYLKEAQLEELIAEKSQLTLSRKDKIDELESLVATTDPVNATNPFAQLDPVAQEKAIQEKIDWTYEEDKNEIAAISNSELEKVQGLIQLDKETQKKLATKKANFDPVKYEAEIKAIARIEKSIQESLSNNQMSMLALPESDDELIARVAKTNSAKRESLYANMSLSELDWKKKEIELDQELLKILINEQDKFKRLGSDNPQVPELKEKADEIALLISKNQDELRLHEGQLKSITSQFAITDPAIDRITDPIITDPIVDNSFSQLSKIEQEQKILQTADAGYTAKKENLRNIPNPTRAQIEEGIAADENMLSEILIMKRNLDPVKDAAKIDAISRIEQKTNQDVNKTELTLASLPESQEAILSRLVNDELRKIQEVKNSSTLTELEKAKKIIRINNAIISSIETEKAKLDDLSKANPNMETLSKKTVVLSLIINKREADIAVLNQEIDKINSDLASTNSLDKVRKGFVTVEELRTEVLKGDEGIVDNNETTIAGLNAQLKKLESYGRELNTLDSTYEFYEKTQNVDFQSERQLVADELGIIELKKRQASISIGELETEAMGSTIAKTQVMYEDASLTKLVNEENELRVALESDDLTSMKEARKLEKKLMNVIGDRMDKENSITAKIVNSTSDDNENKLEKLKSLETNSITEKINIELTENRYKEIALQSQMLEQKAKKSKSPVEQAKLLSQALSKQQEASNLLEMSYVDTKIDNLTKGKINSLMTNGELEARKRNLLVEEANNAAQLAEADAQIKNETNAKMQGQLYDQRDELVKKRSGLNEEIAQVDKKISKAPTPGKPTLPENAKSKELTYLEEREIAESSYYKDLSIANYDARFLEKEILDILKSIDQDKIDAQYLVELWLTNNDKDINKLILKKIATIQNKEVKLEELKAQLKKLQNDLQALLPSDPNIVAKINNLLARSVDPMTKGDAVDYFAIPAAGFEILSTTNTAPVVKAKPISAETPTGFMYRVQVGAFSKPVAEDQFNEFTPVSAEKRSNGLFVYMAGYFVRNANAFEAQKSIRKIGYSDAFVVAYCDGQRITLSEAKRLEETKACTPIELNQISIQNNAPAPTDKKRIMVTELDYYKAIGAAPAFPVEMKKGLFFTVQLGVYNRPVDKKTLKDMSPLITKRLPNGQIRYSVGVYVSIEEAFPKRDQAFEKGITDAYITAYYEGERISLAEAEDLLRKDGTGVIEKTAVGIVKNVESRIEATKKLDNDIQEIVKNKMVKGMNIQLVSKNQYNEFPRDVLNRFNSHASFYYDINDKRIKSNLYSRIDDIPQVYFLRNEIDTTYITDQVRMDKAIKDNLRNVSFEISSTQMEGDLSDMLLRLNYRKEFVREGESIEVILYDVPPAKVKDISDRLRTFRIRAEVVDPAY